jgi:O-acetyl-ADP-ribose deacetylase (regulator of RNase III)
MSADQVGGWTNPSVLSFAAGDDPIAAATAAARRLLDAAVAEGMNAPPVDSLALARMLGLTVRPHNDVTDASILEDPGTADTSGQPAPAPLASLLPIAAELTIAYNPSRPRGRLRFSIAHEIAHALFPDVHKTIRHRTGTGAIAETADGDEWELELLCNIIAAELLLPREAVAGLLDIDTDIDFIMEARRRWDVSTEALLRRLVMSSARPLMLVAASRPTDSTTVPLRVEYTETSEAFPAVPRRGDTLPAGSPFDRCTAVGQTVRGQLTLGGEAYLAQVVGIPGYPGRLYPRVLGLMEPPNAEGSTPRIEYRQGDLLAFDDDSSSPVVLAHVVTDAARAWSRRGVAAALARRYPHAARAFRSWSIASPQNLRLGNVHASEAVEGDRQVTIASVIAQQGYGPGKITRLHYDALRRGLATVAEIAQQHGAELHVPRLGAGQAGGRWDLIERQLAETVAAAGIRVVVHTLPSERQPAGSSR